MSIDQKILFLLAFLATVFGGISAYCDLRDRWDKPVQVEMQGKLPSRKLRLWGRFGVHLLFIFLIWGAVAFDYYDRHSSSFQWDESRPLIQVRDKVFASETVVLDGHEFINCSFDNVTFEYQGTAPTRLTDSRVKIPKEGDRMVRLRSANPIVGQTWILGHSILQAAGISIENLSVEVAP